jgi:acyl carrier protein
MNRAEVVAKLQPIFDGVFLDSPTVTPELSAPDVPEWDSLLHISLVLAIEQGLGIRFRVGEVEGTSNVGELCDVIIKRLTEK